MRTVMLLCGLALGATALPAFAGDQSDTLTMGAKARVEVDAEGRVTSVAFLKAEKMIAAVREPLERAIRSWEFEPATAEGRAVPSVTTVTTQVRAERLGDEDAFVLRIASASAGPGIASTQPPSYPVDAVRAQLQARLVLRVSFDANGIPTGVQTHEAEFTRKNKRLSAKVEQVTHEAVAGWRFDPEIVDGLPVASSVLVPVTFCLHPVGSKYRGCFPEKEQSFPAGTLLAEQPATRLRTEVVGTRL